MNDLSDIKDIKPHKKLEVQLDEAYKKLYESEKYLRTIIESSLDGIAVVDQQGRIEFGNDSFFDIVGWSRDELIGHSFIKMLTDDTKELYLKIWQSEKTMKNTGKTEEVKILTRSGEIRYLLKSRVSAVINGENKFIFIAKNISEKKKLELLLKESEEKFRDLFEKANDPMYTHDANGFILNVNQAGLDGLKCTREEFIGSNISKWLTKESFLKFQERLIKRMSGEPMEQPVDIEVICKDGEHRWAEIRTRVVYENGKVYAIHGIARDITEKKRLEEKLRESEEKYRDLFENAQDAMYVIDIEGNFLKMNQVGLQALGYTREEFIGSNISKFVTPESLKIVKERQKKRHLGEIVNQADIMEMVCKNGGHRWVEIKTRDIKDGDKTIEIHGIARDITENIILKQKLKKSNNQYKLLCHLIQGSRGGITRSKILKHLTDKSNNANQLAAALNLDYKTIRHHLDILSKHGMITKEREGYTTFYFISKNIESDLIEIFGTMNERT